MCTQLWRSGQRAEGVGHHTPCGQAIQEARLCAEDLPSSNSPMPTSCKFRSHPFRQGPPETQQLHQKHHGPERRQPCWRRGISELGLPAQATTLQHAGEVTLDKNHPPCTIAEPYAAPLHRSLSPAARVAFGLQNILLLRVLITLLKGSM